jgi:hypothetical protein
LSFRIAKELAADPEPPKKKRKRAAGVHAADMSLVTPSNVAERNGWKVTTMGRMVRPIRMRPARPLPPQALSTLRRNGKTAAGKDGKEKRRRIREPDVRARRRTIDPTRWDSVHLKGMFLDVITDGPRIRVEEEGDDVMSSGVEDEGSRGTESDSDDISNETSGNESSVAGDVRPVSNPTHAITVPPASAPTSPAPAALPQPSISSLAQTVPTPYSSLDADLTQEKQASLSLLRSLFDARDDNAWIGRESVGSDIDDKEVERLKKEGGRSNIGLEIDGDGNIEEVPKDVDVPGLEMDEGEEIEVDATEVQEAAVEKQPEAPVQTTMLKDLFAPREEEGYLPPSFYAS